MGPTSFNYVPYIPQAHILKVILGNISKSPARPGGAFLQYPHLRGRGRQISVTSSSAWSTQRIPGEPRLHSKTLLPK